MVTILVVCKSARLDCLVDALFRSPQEKKIFVFSEVCSPSVLRKSAEVRRGRTENARLVTEYAQYVKADFVLFGPEEPLFAGVVDELRKVGIPSVGPTRRLAQIEWSKAFTRDLLAKYNILGNPAYKVFRGMDGIEEYLRSLGEFVVKPDGLTGGKGVKVYGEHLHSVKDATTYCLELFNSGQPAVVIEERLDGEEFSLQSLSDGHSIIHTVPVQDHKRAWADDKGPNTGGMGSYSCEDHLLPFLSVEMVEEAKNINALVADALRREFDEGYKGVLFGGFMVTPNGLRVLEYNARFGDPEVMNVLSIMEGDFIEVCQSIIEGTLDRLNISFKSQATVCKYVVPLGYPDSPYKGPDIDMLSVPESTNSLRVFHGAIDLGQDGVVQLMGSRAIAFVGIGNNLSDAESIAENAASCVRGSLFHRPDIGTADLIRKRISHMESLMNQHKGTRRRVNDRF